MKIKKISIGILFLILALMVMPEASAYASFKGTGNHTHPITATQAATCKTCHVANNLSLDLQTCSRCHADPYPPTATSQLTPKETKEIPDEEETQEETETQEEIETTAETAITTVSDTKKPTTPGFGIVAALVGLFTLALLVKRNNR